MGIPWLGWTCGRCDACRRGQENLCPRARFTGYTLDGGYADCAVVDARYAFPLPDAYEDEEGQAFARSLGAVWAGGSDQSPPEPLDAAILFAPVGSLVPTALRAVRPGGVVVCDGIHMSDIPSFPYRILWEERVLRSVANLTRADGEAFLEVARGTRIRAQTTTFPLEEANEALRRAP